ncbi:unnamed protein product [Agarophyton chilense]
MTRFRSVTDGRDLSDVLMPVELAIEPITKADGSHKEPKGQQVVIPVGENDLRAQVVCLKSELNAYRERIIGWSAALHEALIFYLCYGRHHLSSECTLPAKDLVRVLTNYETLSEEERTRVPAGIYWKVKGWLSYYPGRQSGALVIQNPEVPQANSQVGSNAPRANDPPQSGN